MASETKDFLLEIGSEELPSAALMKAVDQLGRLVASSLDEAGLAHGEVRTISTPRRLAALVADVAIETDAVHEVKRGPACSIAFDADGHPTRAAEGFARGGGLRADQLVRRLDKDGKEYVFAEVDKASRPSAPILEELSERCIKALDWPRSQRWGSEHERYGRPVRWICCLFGTEVIPVEFADVVASNTTRGHRVLGAGEHVVPDPSRYEGVLEQAFVLDAERRRGVIADGIAAVEKATGGRVDTPRKVFDEVVNLCEWPTVLVGHFDEEFLEVPHEIICESMLSNQRYFPVYDASGELTNAFVVVSNASPACSDAVVDGNERVVRARLDDAKFFYEEDLAHPLDEFVERLDSVVFQEKLGSMRQKVSRMEVLAAEVAREAGLDARLAASCVRAAHLSKADLVSSAVVEFTNQQGVMGGYYAKAAGERDEVCRAIREHYRPRFATDELPRDEVGRVVAIADKLDTICGIFAIDEPPTGSSDPYAVRRAAIGVINILKTFPKARLSELVGCSLAQLEAQGIAFPAEPTRQAIESFFAGRLASMAKDEGISPDTIEAVRAVGVIDPERFLARARALDKARSGDPEVFDGLATAYARASHLADASLGTEVDRSLLTEPEIALESACERGSSEVDVALREGRYEEALKALASLRGPIDRFFEDVLVMDDDERVRDNRLRLLNRFASVFDGVADIGALARKK